jgi:plastocyanin
MTARRLLNVPGSLPFLLATAFVLVATAASACNTSHCPKGHAHAAPGTALMQGEPTVSTAMISVAPVTEGAILIRNFVFQPATLTVTAGSKVTWTNRDEEPHLVVSAGAQFPASPALDTDDSYSTTFAKPGTYTYFCSIHPHMVGTIVVTASPRTKY